MDCSTPGSSVHEILQARILEWVAISFSRGSSQLRDWTWVSCTVGGFFTNWATRQNDYYKEVQGTSLAVWWFRLHLHCRGHGLHSWLGNWDSTCHMMWPAKIKKSMNKKCWRECREKGTLLHHWEYKLGAATMQNSMKTPWKTKNKGFPDGSVVRNPPASVGDSSIPGLGRSHTSRSN